MLWSCKACSMNAKYRVRKRACKSMLSHLPPSFLIKAAFPPHRHCSHLLEAVQEFDYLGLRLDPKLDMSAAFQRIPKIANKSRALVSAVSHFLRYDNSSQHHRPSRFANPSQMLNLWKSCVLPQLLQNLRYLRENQVERLHITLNSSLAR